MDLEVIILNEVLKVLVAQYCVTLRPHGLQPTRLLCPQNSSGKNTGVGSNSLLWGNLPDPGNESGSLALQAEFLLSEPPGDKKRQISYDITYMWNQKNYTNELTYKTERDPQTQKTNLWLPKGKGQKKGENIQTTIYKINYQQGPTAQHRELYSISCNNL